MSIYAVNAVSGTIRRYRGMLRGTNGNAEGSTTKIADRNKELSSHKTELEKARNKPTREIDNYLNLLDPNAVNPDWKKKNRR